MALGNPIQLRLEASRQREYENAAAAEGKPLATYLRERLEQADNNSQALERVRQDLAASVFELRSLIENSTEEGSDQAILLEMLLLIRSLSGVDKLKMAQAELKRKGFSSWNGGDF